MIKLFNKIGFFLIITAVFLIILSRKNESYLNIGSISLFIGIILSIPDYWIFFTNKKRKGEELDAYWLVKFLTMPIVLVLLIICFFLWRFVTPTN